MNKKFICLVLSLMLLCTASLAFAAPSKTTNDLTQNSTGSVLGAQDSFFVEPIPLTKDAGAALAAIAAFVADGNKPVIDYFGDVVKAQILALLPTDFDATKLVMNELISARVMNYDPVMGDVPVYFTFATAYKEGTTLVVLVGVQNGDSVTWVPLRAVVENGLVKIYFTQQVLSSVNGREIMIAVLSEDTGAQ